MSKNINWNDLRIESIDAEMIDSTIKRGEKIAIVITHHQNKSLKKSHEQSIQKLLGNPVVPPHFIYWVWGPTDIFYQYLNLLVYLLEDLNLNEYSSIYHLDFIHILEDLWRRYKDKPNEYIRRPLKELNIMKLQNDYQRFLQSYEKLYFQFTNQLLFRTQLTEVPSFSRKKDFTQGFYISNKDNIDLYMLDTYMDLWKNIHSLWFLGSSLTTLLHENQIKIPKKVIKNIFEITRKIIESDDFQRLKTILTCIATQTGKSPLNTRFKDIKETNITNIPLKPCTFKNELLNIMVNPDSIEYLKNLLIVIQSMESLYQLFFELNRRDAILAFILNEYDFSIDKNNRSSYYYSIQDIQQPITTFLSFLIKNQNYLMGSNTKIVNNQLRTQFENSQLKIKTKKNIFNHIFNQRLLSILSDPILKLNVNDIREKIKKLKKYQRDIIFKLVLSTNLSAEEPILLEYQGEYVLKKINTPLKIKALFDFYTTDDIIKKDEAFGKL